MDCGLALLPHHSADILSQADHQGFKWRHIKIPNYEKLYELFSKDRATEQGAMMASEQVRQWAMEGNSDQIEVNSDNDEDDANVDPLTPHSVPTHINIEATSSNMSHKRKVKTVDSNQTQMDAINIAISQVVEALREANILAERFTVYIYSKTEVYNGTKDIWVPPHWRMKALLFLTNNPLIARQLFGFPKEEQLDLLVMMMQT